MSVQTLLKDLNAPQKDAVQANEGAYLIIAGAGSGKTTALTRRIAYLIQERAVSPHNILAVTFTNKAAAEMRNRVVGLLGTQSQSWSSAGPLMGTFHSICVRILREHSQHLGYDNTFTILDTHDSQVLVKKIMKQMEISTQQFTPRGILEYISRAKNNLMNPADFQAQANSYVEEQIGAVYDRFQRAAHEDQAMDFDDLIRLTIKLFRDHPNILKIYQERFRYILVDEYQDTNYAQYTLIKLLASSHGNLFVVGDDWQSIYKWRGADVSNILNFERDYPKTQVIKLEQNYRSTQSILDAAYGVIKENADRTDKQIWTSQKGGNKIAIFEAASEAQEAAYIAQVITSQVLEGKQKYSDYVVLYRTNAQSRAVEEYFLKNSVPYRIVGGIKFYERKEIKDICAYLRLIINPTNILALERAVSEPRRGIGAKTLGQWITGARSAGRDFIKFALSPQLAGSVTAASKQKIIASFAQFLAGAQVVAKEKPLTQLISHVFEQSGYAKGLMDGTPEGEARHENVQELLSVASKYDEMPDALSLFLEEIALASDTDKIAQESDMVHLMTLHSAKGLEFPVVFIVGLEEGLVPHNRSLTNPEEMEEERRLMYVGVTRAKQKVHLLHTRQRLLFGSVQANPPSRFLDDIPEELKESVKNESHVRESYFQTPGPTSSQTHRRNPKKDYFATPDSGFADGERVKHQEFGVGVVVASDADQISVVFKGKGLTKLAKQFAKLTKV